VPSRRRTSTLPALAVVALVLGVAGVLAILLIGGSGGDESRPAAPAGTTPLPAGKGSVDVRLDEFSIAPSISQVASGKVTFVARNTGREEHEMVVVRTEEPGGSLLKGDEASEAGAVDEIPEFGAGQTKRLTLNLKPGHYVLLCNVPGHYKAGMYKNFVVR
jgi:uncharacterized cupredoxin-like copper-binding protein